MLVNKYYYGYCNKKKHVTGKGFVDSLSSMFNTIKSATSPLIKTVENDISENKNLIAKPILGALGSSAATGLATGISTIISHIANRKKKKKHIVNPVSQHEVVSENLEPKYKEILQNIVNSKNNISHGNPLTNIIGSGIKIFLRHSQANLPAICRVIASYLPVFVSYLVSSFHLPGIF